MGTKVGHEGRGQVSCGRHGRATDAVRRARGGEIPAMAITTHRITAKDGALLTGRGPCAGLLGSNPRR